MTFSSTYTLLLVIFSIWESQVSMLLLSSNVLLHIYAHMHSRNQVIQKNQVTEVIGEHIYRTYPFTVNLSIMQ